MKHIFIFSLALALICSITSCSKSPQESLPQADTVQVTLSDGGITVDGQAVSTDPSAAVYTANDIIYYEAGHDFTYGEGTEADAHSAEEAGAHTVVHITQPGTYTLSGTLSAGQVAIDLGKDAKNDPAAVVTLILDDLDITCSVAPAIIFYNVYECGNTDSPTKDVDTFAAGANVILADGSTNYVNGSYVARIYKPDTVELNEDGTEVADAKKLHKYDAAFYSKMSMNIGTEQEGTGVLKITAENEGLDSELHLTINGGNTYIASGNDGINTNEDGVSVTTVNGGNLAIIVTGETGEGDGIDSNGWLVINGGTVITAACSNSADAGIDSDMGIHINGGTVLATGHMLDHIKEGGQNYTVFTFAQTMTGNENIVLKNSSGTDILSSSVFSNTYSTLIYSSPDLTPGEYTLWVDGAQQTHSGSSFGGGFGGMMPPSGGFGPNDLPDGALPEMPDGFAPPKDMERPEGFEFPASFEIPEGMDLPENRELPPDFDGQGPGMDRRPGSQMAQQTGESSTVFAIKEGGNLFSGISAAK